MEEYPLQSVRRVFSLSQLRGRRGFLSSFFGLGLVGAVVLVLSSCVSSTPKTGGDDYMGGRVPQNNAPKEKGSPTDYDSYWDASGVKGAPRVVIDLGKEQAFFYKGKTLVGLSRISPGREGFDSPTGNFKITQKSPNHRSNLFGNYVDRQGNVVKEDVDVRRDKPPAGARFEGSPMPYFMRFHGAVGMHAGYLPGYPASHGCIRMPEEMARHFFNNVSKGTPVQVVKSVEASASPRVRRARSAYGG